MLVYIVKKGDVLLLQHMMMRRLNALFLRHKQNKKYVVKGLRANQL